MRIEIDHVARRARHVHVELQRIGWLEQTWIEVRVSLGSDDRLVPENLGQYLGRATSAPRNHWGAKIVAHQGSRRAARRLFAGSLAA
jgi:hypothetical protein